MPLEITEELDISDLKFIRTIHRGKYSIIFEVEWRGQACALKVYHGRVKEPHEHLEVNIFVCESTAYRCLKAEGLCERGVVPDFYGTITNIESKRWPELRKFHKDELPANATLMEYIPTLQRIHMGNRTRERMERLRDILVDIHAARVLHDDTYPRNMGLARAADGVTERLLWFDFDRSQTYPLDEPIPEEPSEWFQLELVLMNDWVNDPPINAETGKIKWLWLDYMTLPQPEHS